MDPRRVALKDLSLFEHVEPELLATLVPAMKIVSKLRGDAILLKDEPVFGIYIVLSGRAGVLDSNISLPVAVFEENETIGERAAIQGLKSSVSVRALSQRCEFALIPRKAIVDLMASSESFAASIYRGLSDVLAIRLSAANARFKRLVATAHPTAAPFSSVKDVSDIESELQAQYKINTSLISGVIMALKQVAESMPEEARSIVMSCAKDLATARENEAKTLILDEAS